MNSDSNYLPTIPTVATGGTEPIALRNEAEAGGSSPWMRPPPGDLLRHEGTDDAQRGETSLEAEKVDG